MNRAPDSSIDREHVSALQNLFQTARSLSYYHDIGNLLAKSGVSRHAANRKWLARELSVSDSMLIKCLQFHRCYTEEQIEQLETEGIKWGHASTAAGYAYYEKRLELLRRAKRNGWDVHELQRAMQRKRKSVRGGGRPRKEQSLGLYSDLSQLVSASEQWNVRYDACRKSLDVGARQLGNSKHRPVLTEKLKRCDEALKSLRANIQTIHSEIGELLAELSATDSGT
jgi:hypothetical protein